MARSPEPMPRPTRDPSAPVLILMIALSLVAAIFGWAAINERVKRVAAEAALQSKADDDEVAGAMIRMGLLQFLIACGHDQGVKGAAREDAIRRCNVDVGQDKP